MFGGYFSYMVWTFPSIPYIHKCWSKRFLNTYTKLQKKSSCDHPLYKSDILNEFNYIRLYNLKMNKSS